MIRFLSLLLLLPCALHAQVDFPRYFLDATMRVDVFHTGTKTSEAYALDKVYREGPWSGSRVNLVDTLNQGEFLVRVFDARTGMLLYSRGYSSVFNEWQTTDEAGTGVSKTMHESVRFPFPKHAVQVTISRRSKYSHFEETWSTTIDPQDPTVVSNEKRAPKMEVVTLMDNGALATKVDILIIGDGYTTADLQKFKDDARHFNEVMFDTPPFKERAKDFNVRAVCAVSAESGIDVPDKNVWKSTALGCMYNTFGSERYVLTEENRALRDLAGTVPYDFICILINDSRYGGGGIYQLYTTTYTIERTPGQEWQRDYVYVHEFGHSFGGLGDEYYSASTGYTDFYPKGVEPWEPNVTRLLDGNLKWSSFVTKGAKIPTDWGKAEYDSLGAVLRTFNRLASDYYEKREPIRKRMTEIMNNAGLKNVVGAFEGAGYVSEGMYRPAIDCRMFSLSLVEFDPVCRAAIERQIDFYTK